MCVWMCVAVCGCLSLRVLGGAPDQPCLPHYYKSAVSNSIIDQMQVMRLNPASYGTTDQYNTTTVHYNTTTVHYNTTTDHYGATTDHYNSQSDSGLTVSAGGTFPCDLSKSVGECKCVRECKCVCVCACRCVRVCVCRCV